MNAPIAASPSRPKPTVTIDSHPARGPELTAKIIAVTPTVTATPPAVSSGPRRPVPGCSGSAGTDDNIRATTGTLTQKIQRHPQTSVMTPPPTIPATNPRPAIAPYTAMARLRVRASVKAEVSSDREEGTNAAAAAPCRTRPATNIHGCPAAPARTDPTANATNPATNVRRRPHRSPSRPNSSSNPPKTSA
jgi:hypothetical protein